MSVIQQSHYIVPAETLATWIESQPDRWWWVDGDPRLTSVVGFPCPADELAPAIRKIGKDLRVYDKNLSAHGEILEGKSLDDLCDTANRRGRKTLLLSWIDLDVEWLLVEDEALV
jgi:hypothetical protein